MTYHLNQAGTENPFRKLVRIVERSIFPFTSGAYTRSDKYANIVIDMQYCEKYFTENCCSCLDDRSVFKQFSNIIKFGVLRFEVVKLCVLQKQTG